MMFVFVFALRERRDGREGLEVEGVKDGLGAGAKTSGRGAGRGIEPEGLLDCCRPRWRVIRAWCDVDADADAMEGRVEWDVECDRAWPWPWVLVGGCAL
jgi:hypothetical protein